MNDALTPLTEPQKIRAALAKLPSSKDNYGKIFLTKLFDKKGADEFALFVCKIDELLSKGVELNTACLSRDELVLLNSVKVNVGMPRRRALWTLGGAVWCAGLGAENLWRRTIGDAPADERTAENYATSVAFLAIGLHGCRALFTDGFYDQRITSVAAAMDEYMRNKKLVEFAGR